MTNLQGTDAVPDGGTDPDASGETDANADTDDQRAAEADGNDAAAEDVDDASEESAEEAEYAVLLDVMPRGLPEDERPEYQKSPVAYALGEEEFRLFELTLTEDADVSVSDRVQLTPREESAAVDRYREVDYADLTRNAETEIEYAVADIVDTHEQRFVDFYNEAGPITLRLHQLNLLPGIGKKLRNNILDERKRKPFESFEELEERVSGLHSPKDDLVERIVEEIEEEDLKYRRFVAED
ncbi:DUF655 domain-containing protein [Haloparvum sp. PAK95]|uniref:DUF655 domain-containing protein n=1 Tax=Haloparvum sp. PAK95 TaxID=3418962 RepID=UPI003D2F2DAC